MEALLDPGETDRYRRFRFDPDRTRYLAAHVLLRTILSRYAAVPPGEWVFRTTEMGRPEIEAVGDLPPLRFSLSHTRGLVVVLVCLGVDCGVDAEAVRPLADGEALERRVLADDERAGLADLPEAARRDRFIRLWTLKEAYLKARGVGLRLPMGGISLDLDRETPALRLEPRMGDRAADWQLWSSRPTVSHRLAVALRRGRGPALEVRVRGGDPPDPGLVRA